MKDELRKIQKWARTPRRSGYFADRSSDLDGVVGRYGDAAVACTGGRPIDAEVRCAQARQEIWGSPKSLTNCEAIAPRRSR